MGYARYVGRVGGLAVALGVGVAVATTPATAWAEESTAPADAPSSTAESVTSEGDGEVEVSSGDTSTDPDRAVKEATDAAAPDGMQLEATGGAITSTTKGSAGAEEDVEDDDVEGTESSDEADDDTVHEESDDVEDTDESAARTADAPSPAADRDSGAPSTPIASAPNRSQRVSLDGSAPKQAAPAPRTAAPVVRTADPVPRATVSVQPLSGAPDVAELTSVVTPMPSPEPTATTWVTNLLSWAGFSPTAGGEVPAPAGESPVLLGLMAAWRRLSQDATAGDPTSLRQVAETDTALMLASAAVNTAPSAAPVVATPNQATGAVTVSLHAVDPDGNPVSYTVTRQPVDGTLTETGAGTYTYTPTAVARLRAGTTTAPDFDSFTVAVSDGQTTTPVAINVPVLPAVWANQPSASNVTGASPYGVALVGNTAYVTNHGANTVTVIDTLTGQTVGTPIVVGSAPGGVVASPNGAYVYVANKNSGTVSVIRTSDNKVIDINPATATVDSIKVGSQPEMIAINTSDITTSAGVIKAGTRLYVTNSYSGTVSVIDVSNPAAVKLVDANPATSTVDAIKVGANPRGVVFAQTANGPRIYVVNRGSGTVSVIDAVTNKVVDANPATPTVDAITVGSAPQQIVASPDGRFAYVTNYNSHTVSIVDTTTNKLVDAKPSTTAVDGITVGSNPIGVAVSHDGSLLYVATGSDRVSVIDTKTRAVVTTLQIDTAVENNSHMVAVRQDGMLVVTDLADRALRRVSYVRGNTAPVVTAAPAITTQDLTNGTVTGSVGVKDWDGDALTFAVAAQPTTGTVTFGPAGSWTFSPNEAARQQAARTPGYTASFTIVASDGRGGTVSVPVSNVPIQPANQAPVVSPLGPRVDQPNLTNGTVTGALRVTDPDNNPLTYTVISHPSHGGVEVAPDGSFAYTPTQAAREAAAGGGPRTDTFVVRVSDAQSSVDVSVTVPISAAATEVTTSPIVAGSGSSGVVVSGNGAGVVNPNRAYVVNTGGNSVTVVDTTTDTVTATINVGPSPLSLAISPDGSRVYVTNSEDNTVSVINTTTRTVVATIQVPVQPTWNPELGELPNLVGDIVVTPTGDRIYVTATDGTIYVIDASTNAVMATNSVGYYSDLKISADGRHLYGTHSYGAARVTVLDIGSGGVVTHNSVTAVGPVWDIDAMQSEFADATYNVALSPDGTRMYVTYRVTTVARGTGGHTSGMFIVDARGQNWKVTGRYTAVAELAIDRVTGRTTEVARIPVAAGAQDVAVSNDGRTLYVTSWDGASVTTIDTATRTVTGGYTTDETTGATPRSLTFYSIGYFTRFIAVGSDGRVYVTDFDDGALYVSSIGSVAV